MNRDIFTNKWTIGAIGILILFAAACYLYYQQTTAHDREQTAQAEKQLQQWKANKEPKPTIKAEAEETQTPAESTTPTAEKPITTDTTVVTKNTDPTQGQADVPAQTAETADVPVSPYGFGPYPEVPIDFPFPVEWNFPNSDADHELMARVAIKLWTQGIETMGVTMGGGLVYPNYIDTVYISWGETTDDDGNPIQYIHRLGGYPPACLRIIENNIARLGERGTRTAADIPSDVTVKLYDEAGIDPYTFLELPK